MSQRSFKSIKIISELLAYDNYRQHFREPQTLLVAKYRRHLPFGFTHGIDLVLFQDGL